MSHLKPVHPGADAGADLRHVGEQLRQVQAFSAADDATWPATLTIAQIGEIYQRKVGGIRKSCQAFTFVPAPFLTRPYRWRKVDVVRHVIGARGARLQRVG